ncbi:hypothetical protein ZWY2020_046717 [Hordeum vulgare]|nr:hypothetical protein ZWY2020_046717 [Hordeum vulgare]
MWGGATLLLTRGDLPHPPLRMFDPRTNSYMAPVPLLHPSVALTAAEAQISPPSPNHRSLADHASVLQLLVSPPACLSSVSPCPRAKASTGSPPDRFNAGSRRTCIFPSASAALPSRLPQATPSAQIVPRGARGREASSVAPPRPQLQSLIVAPGSTPRASAQSFSADDAADPSMDWNLVRSRKEKRVMKATSSGDLHRQRRAPPSDPVALQQHLAFKARFNGRCFRCLSKRHRLASCRDPIRCIRCKGSGHLARSCTSKLHSQLQPPTRSLPQHPPPPQANPAAWPALPMRPGLMEFTPGLASRRPERSSCIVVSSPEMEADAYHLPPGATLPLLDAVDLNIASSPWAPRRRSTSHATPSKWPRRILKIT